ncbi:YcjX family protein [Alteromonas sp. CYL-A6]|uniref:YcjX family protein n=1 Tax=Alteromonas nitratireducens TaxID=3390813 RepID=UPI0034A9E1D6
MREQVSQWFASGAERGQRLGQWLTRDKHRFTITGLSRSGKSMLFTSLMTMLKYRTEDGYACLPLLTRLPSSLVETVSLEPLPGFERFPLDQHMTALQQGRWPASTTTAYGFTLRVGLRRTGSLTRWLLPYSEVVFEFIDYPGEWLTDLPMLNKQYVAWSDSTWAQQGSGPQRQHAGAWHKVVNGFDFEQPPTPENRQILLSAYLDYLTRAKADGISMLQPGSFLLSDNTPDLTTMGFTPLPSSVTSDPSHPWTQAFDAAFNTFKQDWLKPVRKKVFRQTDKQLILVDLFEGLHHSRQHLYQLKETLSHLAETFTYGDSQWFARTFLGREKISKVAFVATKADTVPASEHDNLLSLLHNLTEGARAKFADKAVRAEHFLVSAIQATDAGRDSHSMRYSTSEGQYMEARFDPLPARINALEEDSHFPALDIGVPNDMLPRILNSRGLDRLFQFLLD